MQNLLLKVAGLYSFPNTLSSIPEGALLRAKNVVINRDNVAEPRRGFKIYGSTMGAGLDTTAHQLLNYKGRIFRHFGPGPGTTLELDTNGAGVFATFSTAIVGTLTIGSPIVNAIVTTSQLVPGMNVSGPGIPLATTILSITNNTTLVLSNDATLDVVSDMVLTWTIEEVVEGLRIRGVEQNSNFYFTTSQGIQKISASSAANLNTAIITAAGGIKALDLAVSLNSQIGFFEQECVIAYRLVWGIKDTNDNLILGAPSGRAIIANSISTLLTDNFNELLALLDTSNVATGIDAADYVALLKITTASDPAILWANLIALATKLDADVPTFTTVTNAGNVAAGTGFLVTLTLTTDMTAIIAAGDKITTTVAAFPLYNATNVEVVAVDATTVQYIVAVDPTAGGLSAGTIQRTKYSSIIAPEQLSPIPITNELLALQEYFDAIVEAIKLEPAAVLANTNIFFTINSTQSSTTNVTFSIPQGVTTAHFYQLYRTYLTRAAGVTSLSNDGSGNPYDPGDELKLAYEANPTNEDLTRGTITIHDITPDSFLGANLYTNPNSGSGIAQSNDVPPLAKDITYFKGYTFYSNTSTRHRLLLNMLSVIDFVSGVSSITISDGTTTHVYTFVIGLANTQTITTVADVGGSLNSTYFTLNSGDNVHQYYYYFTNGAGVDPAPAGATLGGAIVIVDGDSANNVAIAVQAALNQNSDFTVSVAANVVTIINTTVGISSPAANGAASPGFAYATVVAGQGENATTRSILFTQVSSGFIISNSVANPTVVTTLDPHGLISGQIIQIENSNSVPPINGSFAVLVLSPTTFSIPVNVNTTAGTIGAWRITPLLTPAQQITQTAESLIRVINKTGDTFIYAYYLSGSVDIPGAILLETRRLAQDAFTIVVDSVDTGEAFDPTLPTPAQVAANPALVNSSTNETSPNRVYYSKYQQPEAVPLLNYMDIGPKDNHILRILGLRDNLFILKEEGIYRLSGLSAPFSVFPFDFSTILKAPDSAVVLNNLIYMMSNQGVATISDTGVAIISRPIEDKLINLVQFDNFFHATFGVSYESDRAFYLFIPTFATDNSATQCFRFNTFTNTWTMLDMAKRSGLVNSSNDKLYLGAADTNYIEIERKSFDRTDNADREVVVALGAGAVTGAIITVPSLVNISVGDVAVQVQNLTLLHFNQMLSKLDNDVLLNPHAYKITHTALPGNNLSTKLDALITTIANDVGRLATVGATPAVTYTLLLPTAAGFVAQQTKFNALVALLNNDPGMGFHNYHVSEGTRTYEFPIISVNPIASTITTLYTYPIIEGSITVYNHYEKDVQFVPQYLTDVSLTKHVSEGTFIFDDCSFTNVNVLFSSDLSASFESQIITGSGTGVFGNDVFGDGIFGGNGSAIPFRTLLPKEKQRVRYVNCRMQHTIAREQFLFYGISLVFSISSHRGWR